MTLLYYSGVKIPIVTCTKGPHAQVLVYISDAVKLKPYYRQMIMISGLRGTDLALLARDFLYKPLQQNSFIAYAHLVNSRYTTVLVENNSPEVIALLPNLLVGHISDPEFHTITPVTEANVYHLTSVLARKPLWS